MKRFFLLVLLITFLIFSGCLFKKPSVEVHKTSKYWSMRNAKSGSASAQKMLGSMYYLGDGVPKDLEKAYAWYKLAANQGDAGAQKFVDIITVLLTADQMEEAQNQFLTHQSEIKNGK